MSITVYLMDGEADGTVLEVNERCKHINIPKGLGHIVYNIFPILYDIDVFYIGLSDKVNINYKSKILMKLLTTYTQVKSVDTEFKFMGARIFLEKFTQERTNERILDRFKLFIKDISKNFGVLFSK